MSKRDAERLDWMRRGVRRDPANDPITAQKRKKGVGNWRFTLVAPWTWR